MRSTHRILPWLLALPLACEAGPEESPPEEPADEVVPAAVEAPTPTPRAAERAALVETTMAHPWDGRPPVTDPAVLEAMRAVPRHEFVPAEVAHLAYADRALPIGHDQTISQPYMVAWMTQSLKVGPGDRVLEIGTGSGYQAAVLAEMGVEVCTIEIVAPLGRAAAERLKRLGYGGVRARIGDGYLGWPEWAPFDAVIVTAAPDHVPTPLKEQLAVGGRLVIPVGDVGGVQSLLRLTRQADGSFTEETLMAVTFVPFTGEHVRRPDG